MYDGDVCVVVVCVVLVSVVVVCVVLVSVVVVMRSGGMCGGDIYVVVVYERW